MKRIISILLSIAILLTVGTCFIGCEHFKFNDDRHTNATRGEWIKMLSTTLGMDEYLYDTPYFKDINAEDELFQYIQSSYEWGLLSNTEANFVKDELATTEFVAITAAKAIDENLNDETAKDFAKSNNLIAGRIDDSTYITLDKCRTVVEKTQTAYINLSRKVEDDVLLTEQVKDLKNTDSSVTQIDDNNYSISGVVPEVGQIYITPATAEYPAGRAVKVSEVIANSDGTYNIKTIEPELSEVVKEINVAQIAVPDVEDIRLSEGATVKSNGGFFTGLNTTATEPQLTNMVANSATQSDEILLADKKPKGASFSIDVNFTKGTVGITKGWENVSTSASQLIPGKGSASPDLGKWFEKSNVIPDKTLFGPDIYNNDDIIEQFERGEITANELQEKLKKIQNDDGTEKIPSMTNKFSGGYEIKGSIGIENMYIYPQIKLSTIKVFGVDTKIPDGVENVSVEINCDITAELSIEGKLENELTVCSIPIAVGTTGVTVDVDLILYVEANGELSVKAVVNNNSKVEYSKGKFKKTSSKSSSVTAEASLTLEAGPGVKATLKFLGLEIINADLTFAVLIEASAKGVISTTVTEDDENVTIDRTTKFVTGVDGYVPIIKLKFGTDPNTFANKLKITKTFTLCDKESAYNFVILDEKEYIIWQDIKVLPKHKEENDSSEVSSTDNSNSNIINGVGLNISEFFVELKVGSSQKIELTSVPDGYSQKDFKWTTSNGEIATVDNNGVISARKQGSVTVTVSSMDGEYSAQVSVYVSNNE